MEKVWTWTVDAKLLGLSILLEIHSLNVGHWSICLTGWLTFLKAGKLDLQKHISMLPCVCSVIDLRWSQNVVKNKWYTMGSRVFHRSVLPHFDVSRYLLLNRTMATWIFLSFSKIKIKMFSTVTSSKCLSSRRGRTQSKYMRNSAYHIESFFFN